MTIGTNAAIEFFGTQDTIDLTTASVASGAFSIAADQTPWTNDDDAISASLVFGSTFSVAPAATSEVSVFVRIMDIDGTNDPETPSAAFPFTFLGSCPVDNVTSGQFISIDISLPNTKTSQIYNFYIQNNSDQTLSAGWTLKITPKAIGPHA